MPPITSDSPPIAAQSNRTICRSSQAMRCSNEVRSFSPLRVVSGGWTLLPLCIPGSNEATYGLREGGAGLHRNRPELARLNQHFRQASFAEFEMLMGFDDEVLKRYGLPKPMVERARPSSSWSSIV